MKDKKKLTPFQINIIFFAIFLLLTICYYASAAFFEERELYYRTWITVIGDILAFLIVPASFVSLFITGKPERLRKEKGIVGKIAYTLVVFLFGGLLFLYIRTGSTYLWGRDSWEKETYISAHMIEGVAPVDIAKNIVTNYYLAYSPFLKEKISYSREIGLIQEDTAFREARERTERELMPESQKEEETMLSVEEAYECLYHEVFEPLGDAYDCRYNAKGNFYGLLSEGKGKLNDETPEMDTVRTVVYDRISKNNKCHIFVYYETYNNQDGSEYTTAIRNTYAVDMTTGEVTESGKHAWADTGSAAYQEAAGEL